MKQKIPFIIAVFGMACGVFIAILFGANEAIFQDKISRDILKNEKIMQIENLEKRDAKINKEKDKNWRYYQRFHFHSTGIGAMSLATLILLAFSLAPATFKLISSYMISIGGFLYPFVWLFAGMYGPIMGRPEAKESFAIFGYMGGIFFLGLLAALFLLVKYPLQFQKSST